MKTVVAFLLLAFANVPSAVATFHLWDLNEVYSNADGSVQFVELSTTADGQEQLGGQTITLTVPGATRTFTFGANLASSATAHHSLLIGTDSLHTLYGIEPDYV